MDTPQIVAAGAVVSRKGPQVLLIHRPKYDDWSFPKGKLDPGEHPVAAAVREVAEETGLDIRLGPPLPDRDYVVGNGTLRSKRVHYWAGRVVGDNDVSSYSANDEVDEVAWVDLDDARHQLTHDYDRETLQSFTRVRKRSTPLLVLRHAQAKGRRAWHQDDRERPLTTLGQLQSDQLVPILAAYGVRRIVTSSSRRCWTTLAPYADVARVDLQLATELSEEDADETAVTSVVHDLLTDRSPTVLCTHRPVLPAVWAAVGVRPVTLEPAALRVIHHRNGEVVAVEQHSG